MYNIPIICTTEIINYQVMWKFEDEVIHHLFYNFNKTKSSVFVFSVSSILFDIDMHNCMSNILTEM